MSSNHGGINILDTEPETGGTRLSKSNLIFDITRHAGYMLRVLFTPLGDQPRSFPCRRNRGCPAPLFHPPQKGEGIGVTTGRFPLSHAKRPHFLREEVVDRRASGGSWR